VGGGMVQGPMMQRRSMEMQRHLLEAYRYCINACRGCMLRIEVWVWSGGRTAWLGIGLKGQFGR